MPANKNHHFVPRCHLRPFSLGEEGRAINLYNWRDDRGVQHAPTKGQCSRDYFYGRDGALERMLQGFEGRYGTVVAGITSSPATVADEDLSFLAAFAYLQMSRTESAIKKRQISTQELDEISYRGFEDKAVELADTSHDRMVRSALKTWASSRGLIRDLRIVLLRNETSLDFVTSDDPAILLNRLCAQRLGGRPFGLISTGVQLLMPITPRILLLSYDKDAYSAPHRQGRWLSLRKQHDVGALNELQFISCSENIYFKRWDQLESIRGEFHAAIGRRPSEWFSYWVGVPVGEDENHEYYRRATEAETRSTKPRLVQTSPVFPTPTCWLTELAFRPKVTGWSNGSAVGMVREAHSKPSGASAPFRKLDARHATSYSRAGPDRVTMNKRGGA